MQDSTDVALQMIRTRPTGRMQIATESFVAGGSERIAHNSTALASHQPLHDYFFFLPNGIGFFLSSFLSIFFSFFDFLAILALL